MTHNDYNAAKFRAPIAVYCGSVPKMKPGFASLRNGDSNLQLYGNRWAGADPAALQSSLSLQMKRSYLWGGDDRDLQPEILPPPLDLEGKSDPFYKSQRNEEVDSAALETARLKDKLKRKMSESSSARGAPTESMNTPLKPAVPRSASQRLMTVTKPVPPIQKSPTPRLGTSEEDGLWKNGLENEDHMEGQREKTSAITESSLQYVRSSAERKRKSLGGVVIPPISKSSNFRADQVRNNSAQHAGNSPRSEAARKSFSLELETDRISDADPAVESDSDPISSKPTRTDGERFPQLVKEEEGKENHSRVSVSISKSAQDKMRQKQQEIENLRNQKRRSQQQMWEGLQGVDVGGEAVSVTSFTLSGLNAVPISAEKRRGRTNMANISLNKWASRPSLPSIPTVNPEPAVSDFRHSSAFSLPASFMDLSDTDSENGGPRSSPMSHPEQGVVEALKCLNHKDWEQKEKGLLSLHCLASWHPEVLCVRIHDVCMAVTREVSNLRSKVSRHAIKTIGELFRCLRRNMDQEVEEIVRVLLHKIGDSNDFIREEADNSLEMMVENASPSKALCALIAGGVSHRNSSVRKCSAKHLLRVAELLGADKLLCGSRESMDTFLRTLVRLVQDGQQDTRFYGRRMFSLVMAHPKFEAQMERLIPSHDLRDLITTVKQKELSDSISEIPSARGQRPSQKNSAVALALEVQPAEESFNRPADVDPEPQESPVPRKPLVRAAEVTEQMKELSKLLSAKEYQSKMDGVTLLLEHCRNNVKFVTSNITPIFDAFNPRMQDANKKVNQYALESAVVMIPILKDSLHHVLVPMVTVITDNLNSKHTGIYVAAVTVLDTLIKNIDNLWLLQPFSSRVRFLSGRAMSDVTERLSGLVSSVYIRKPQAVERHVLPVLWFFLSNITGNGVLPGRNGNFKDVVTKLAKNLHGVMGPSLEEYASGQSQHAIKMLADILGTNK